MLMCLWSFVVVKQESNVSSHGKHDSRQTLRAANDSFFLFSPMLSPCYLFHYIISYCFIGFDFTYYDSFFCDRVPVVCSKKFDTMNALVPCLSPDASHTDRRQALLLLNNLCIPQDNKKQILLGERRDVMLHSLLLILQRRLPEVHIAAASLYNLSFLEETKLMLLQYTPPPSLMMGEEGSAISKSQSSLLRIVEDMVVDFTPCLSLGTRKTTSTVEAASVRWCMALMRNLVTERDNATIVAAKTKFPVLAAQILLESDGDLSHWKRDSVEDSSLLLLLLLVRTGGDEACRAMDCGELRAACHAVSQYPGIHGVRAGVIAQRLEEVQPSNIADEHKTDDPVEAARELYYRRPRNDEVDRKRDLNGLRSLDDEEYDRATMASF